jgi:ribosomal protein L29
MKRKELARWYRKADAKDFRNKLDELNTEKFKIFGKLEKMHGSLKDDAMKIRNIKREIALLKTIANERGIKP